MVAAADCLTKITLSHKTRYVYPHEQDAFRNARNVAIVPAARSSGGDNDRLTRSAADKMLPYALTHTQCGRTRAV